MSESVALAVGALGIVLFALAATSSWLKSKYFYYSILLVCTILLILGLSASLVPFVKLPLLLGVILVYVFLFYLFTYKQLLQEPFLVSIHPEKLKQAVVKKSTPTLLERLALPMPWILVILLISTVVSAYVAGY